MFILLKVKRTNLVHLPDDTQPYFKLCTNYYNWILGKLCFLCFTYSITLSWWFVAYALLYIIFRFTIIWPDLTITSRDGNKKQKTFSGLCSVICTWLFFFFQLCDSFKSELTLEKLFFVDIQVTSIRPTVQYSHKLISFALQETFCCSYPFFFIYVEDVLIFC